MESTGKHQPRFAISGIAPHDDGADDYLDKMEESFTATHRRISAENTYLRHNLMELTQALNQYRKDLAVFRKALDELMPVIAELRRLRPEFRKSTRTKKALPL